MLYILKKTSNKHKKERLQEIEKEISNLVWQKKFKQILDLIAEKIPLE